MSDKYLETITLPNSDKYTIRDKQAREAISELNNRIPIPQSAATNTYLNSCGTWTTPESSGENSTYSLTQDSSNQSKLIWKGTGVTQTTYTIPNTTYATATTNTAGLMSAVDKTVLNSLETKNRLITFTFSTQSGITCDTSYNDIITYLNNKDKIAIKYIGLTKAFDGEYNRDIDIKFIGSGSDLLSPLIDTNPYFYTYDAFTITSLIPFDDYSSGSPCLIDINMYYDAEDTHTWSGGNPYIIKHRVFNGSFAGLVPSLNGSAERQKFLKGDGTWATPGGSTYDLTQDSNNGHKLIWEENGTQTTFTIPDNNTTYNIVTTSVNGLMSSTDKSKLNSYPSLNNNGQQFLSGDGQWKTVSSGSGVDNNTTYTLTGEMVQTTNPVGISGYNVTLEGSDDSTVSTLIPTFDPTQTDRHSGLVPHIGGGAVSTSKFLSGNGTWQNTWDISTFTTSINGLVPHPNGPTATTNHFLTGNGSWRTLETVTTTANGLMSSTDKNKLDSYPSLNNSSTQFLSGDGSWRTVSSGSGIDNDSTYSLTQDSSDKHKLIWQANGTTPATFTIPDNNTTYGPATTAANGLMSSTDKKKLDVMSTVDNNTTYSLTISTAANSTAHLISGSSTIANITIPNTTNTTYDIATTVTNGLMSSTDKRTLDSLNSSFSDLQQVVEDDLISTGTFTGASTNTGYNINLDLKNLSNSSLLTKTVTIPLATTSSAGLMSSTDKRTLSSAVQGFEFLGASTNTGYRIQLIADNNQQASQLIPQASSATYGVVKPNGNANQFLSGDGTWKTVSSGSGVDNDSTYSLIQDTTDGHKLIWTANGATPATFTIPDANSSYNLTTQSSGGYDLQLVWNNNGATSSIPIPGGGSYDLTQLSTDGHKLIWNNNGTNTTYTIPDNNTTYDIMSVEEGINGTSTIGRVINAQNLEPIIREFADTSVNMYAVGSGDLIGTTATNGYKINLQLYDPPGVSYMTNTTVNIPIATTSYAGVVKPDNTATHFLNGTGGWTSPPNTTYNTATTNSNGLMSSTDKAGLEYMRNNLVTQIAISGQTTNSGYRLHLESDGAAEDYWTIPQASSVSYGVVKPDGTKDTYLNSTATNNISVSSTITQVPVGQIDYTDSKHGVTYSISNGGVKVSKTGIYLIWGSVYYDSMSTASYIGAYVFAGSSWDDKLQKVSVIQGVGNSVFSRGIATPPQITWLSANDIVFLGGRGSSAVVKPHNVYSTYLGLLYLSNPT